MPESRQEPSVRGNIGRLLDLAGPVVVAELGWMAMGVVDTIMVGPLGPSAIGAVGLGASLFLALAIFGMGLLLGLDTLVSQAFGAGKLAECRRWLVHGLALATLVAVPMVIVLLVAANHVRVLGLHPDVEPLTRAYLETVTWSLPPLLLYAACRRYLQGMAIVRPVTFALVTANLVNAAVNYVLIFGALGAPALGVRGAAWATVLSRVYMVSVLAYAIWEHDRQGSQTIRSSFDGIHAARLGRLFRIGFPAAAQMTLEVGVFATATALAGRLDPVALAAHQIALNIAGTTFMVPLGVSSAAAVLVGHAVGRGDPRDVSRSGWTAIAVIAAFMLFAAAVLVSVPRWLLRPFTNDEAVLLLGSRLLLVAAVFQLFDGMQVVSTGALRGLGNTRSPMVWNLVGHWGVGLPVAYYACFELGWGVLGLWTGLGFGLGICGVVLLGVWNRQSAAVWPRPAVRAAT
jgi:MATE family multidrug resistance protein